MDAFYVSVELRRRPELRGLPVIVAGNGPRVGRHDRLLRGAALRRRLGDPGLAGAAAVPRRRVPRARLRLLPRGVGRGDGRSCARTSTTVEVIGLDEAYLDLTGLPAPHARRCGGSRARSSSAPGSGARSGSGPNKLVAKVASDAEKPRGFVVLTREQACARFAPARCGLIPGIGPKTAERLRALGLDTLGQLARRRSSELAASRSAPRLGGRAAASGAVRGRQPRSPRSARWCPSRVRRRSTPTSPTWPSSSRCWTRWSTRAVRGPRARSAGAGARSGSRCASTTSPPTLGRGRWPSRSDPPTGSGRWRCELLRRFAPPRPVRLLGVRVAGLQFTGDAVGAQLTLAV